MVASIMGLDPWRTSRELFNEIFMDEEKPVTPAMQRGMDLEPQALAWLNRGCTPPYEAVVVQHVEYDWLMASLDGFRWTGAKNCEIAEIKHPGKKTYNMAVEGNVPEYYNAQMQFQMWITDTWWCWYVCSDGTLPVKTAVDRSELFVEKMFAIIFDFKARLDDFRPPEECVLVE